MELSANKIFRTVPANPTNYEQPNYEVYSELRVEKTPDSGLFERTLTQRLSPDTNDEVTFELQDGIADFFPLPDFNPYGITEMELITDNQVRAQFWTAESYGEPAVLTPLVQSSTFRVLNGGVPKLFDGDFFASYLPSAKQFLTWHPGTKRVDINQPELLHIYTPTGTTSLKLNLKVYFTDQTDVTVEKEVLTGVLPNRIYRIPAGYTQLNVNAVDGTKQVSKYQIWITNQSNAIIAEAVTYKVDIVTKSNTRYWMFVNSLGMWETIRTTGKATNELEVEREVSAGYLQQGYSRAKGEFRSRVIGSTDTLQLSTGYLESQAESLWAKELVISNNVYLLELSRRIPYIITTDSFRIYQDLDYQWYLRFDAQLAYNDIKGGRYV